MTNLLRRCENCVFGHRPINNIVDCEPVIPEWMYPYVERQYQMVKNNEAETCSAFRLRDIGENHNV